MSLDNIINEVRNTIQNPFGIDFEKANNKIYIPIGCALNLLGYVDFLERIVGAARVALGLIAMAIGKNDNDRIIAAGHVLRGIFEMMGNYEKYMFILDVAFTIKNIAMKYWKGDQSLTQLPA